MDGNIRILVATAFSVGLLHTFFGPDHYVPFVAMAKSNRWSVRKTFLVTALCGLGHVGGSIVIGAAGLALGSTLMQIESLESLRGDGAAWLLIGFGLAYFTWGMMQAFRDPPHAHTHAHADGTVHSHLHRHDVEHRHVHDSAAMQELGGEPQRWFTPWLLFLIFVFGPCEALVPLLMYPAAKSNVAGVALVTGAFALATVGTMVALVMSLAYGLDRLRLPDMHRYSHAAAGLAMLTCGALVKLGL